MLQIFIRSDASSKIGFGHFKRSEVLYHRSIACGIEVKMVVNSRFSDSNALNYLESKEIGFIYTEEVRSYLITNNLEPQNCAWIYDCDYQGNDPEESINSFEIPFDNSCNWIFVNYARPIKA